MIRWITILKHKIVSYFKDYYDNILMIVGLAMSVFLLTNATSVISQMEKELEQSKKFDKHLIFSCENQSDNEIDLYKLMDMLKDYPVNTIISNVRIRAGEMYNLLPVSIYVSYNEGIRFQNQKEIKAGDTDIKQNGVIVRKDIMSYTYHQNSKDYLIIGDKNFEVLREIDTSEGDDNTAVLIWDKLDDSYREMLIQEMGKYYVDFNTLIKLESDSSLTAIYESLSKKIKEAWGVNVILIEGKENINQFNTEKHRLNLVLMGAMLLFSIISCILISDLWICRRIREYGIRKAFGMNMRLIVLCISKELGKIYGISIGLSFLMQGIFGFSNFKTVVNWGSFLSNIVFISCGAVCIFAIMIVRPYLYISKIQPAQTVLDRQN